MVFKNFNKISKHLVVPTKNSQGINDTRRGLARGCGCGACRLREDKEGPSQTTLHR